MITTREFKGRTSLGGGFPPIDEPPQDFGHGRDNNHKNRRQQIQEARENGQVFRLMGLLTIDGITEPYVRLSARAKADQTPDRNFDVSRRLILAKKRSRVDRFTQKHTYIVPTVGGSVIAGAAIVASTAIQLTFFRL